MVTLHFSFYVEDYSNSMSHLQGVSFTQSTEGQAFLPRLSLIFHSLCQWRGISGGRATRNNKVDSLLEVSEALIILAGRSWI